MATREYLMILAEAGICMLAINVLAFYVSRKGLITKILVMTSPTIAASFVLGFMFARLGFTPVTGSVFFVVTMLVSPGFIWVMSRWVVKPINVVAEVGVRIAEGDLDQRIEIKSKDEIGDMVGSVQDVIAYLQEVVKVVNRIAQGDLLVNVEPRSERDALGQAFSQMIANLRDLVGQVADNADAVGAAAGQLSAAADQS
ncbi:MAG: HAMP domain-containing protein, partial [Anaerolineae bacterium]